MRNISAVLMSVIILLSITGCALTQSAKSQISDASQATLRFVYADTEIVQVLDADDAAKIADIFSGKDLDGTSIPSCGFSEDISIAFGEQVFAIACDDCAIIKDCSTDKYFDITREDKEYIVSVFEEYGGHFPCV